MASMVIDSTSRYSCTLTELSSLTLLESVLETNNAPITEIMPNTYKEIAKNFAGADILKNPLYKNMHTAELVNKTFNLIPSHDSNVFGEHPDYDITIHDSTLHTNFVTFGRRKIMLFDKFTKYRSRLSKYESYFKTQDRLTDLCFLNCESPIGYYVRPNSTLFLNVRLGRHTECQSLSCTTLIVDIGANSDVTINEDYFSNRDCQLFNIVYIVREGGSLTLQRNYYQAGYLVNESKIIQYPFSDFKFECKANSDSSYVIDAMDIEVWNDCNTMVLSRVGCNSTTFNMSTNIVHKAKNSVSTTDVKSVNNKSSKFTFLGNINIDKLGDNVSAKLYNKNLVIDKESTVITEPKLDINNKNIECSHGCTVSYVDQEQLYYLGSRGLERKQSIDIVSEAFLES